MNHRFIPALLMATGMLSIPMAAQSLKKPPMANKAKTAATTKAPSTWQPRTFVNSVGMEFIEIPAGRLSQASAELTGIKLSRTVEISKPFFLGRYEVTQEQWFAIKGTYPGEIRGRNLPAGGVSWDEAQSFILLLNNKECVGRYRLPTEAEWEYAARAGTKTLYWFGSDQTRLTESDWTSANSGGILHPVGQLKANPWGLYDMYGNVAEWCQDWYDLDAYRSGPYKDPIGPADGEFKVIRGGSYHRRMELNHANSVARTPSPPYFAYFPYPDFGFRVVWEPPPDAALKNQLDPALSKIPWAKRAEVGEAAAEFQMAEACWVGRNVAKDWGKAFQWASRAANQGHAQAQIRLGNAFLNGEGVSKDPERSTSWYGKAAEQGDPHAQWALGRAYETGLGATKNPLKAFEWYQKAADQAYPDGLFALALCYHYGLGVLRNFSRAAVLYRRGAELNHPGSANNLGVLYENGTGVEKNRNLAIEWYRKGAVLGDENAKKSLSRLRQNW